MCLNGQSAPGVSALNLNYFVRLFDFSLVLSDLNFNSFFGFFGFFNRLFHLGHDDLDADKRFVLFVLFLFGDLRLSHGVFVRSLNFLGFGCRFFGRSLSRGCFFSRFFDHNLNRHGLFSRFRDRFGFFGHFFGRFFLGRFLDGSGEVSRIQLHIAEVDAIVVLLVLISRGFFFVQISQAAIVDVQGLALTAHVGSDADDVIRGQFAFARDALDGENDRFGVDRAGGFLQLRVSKHGASGQLRQARHKDHGLRGGIFHRLSGLLSRGRGFGFHFGLSHRRRSLFGDFFHSGLLSGRNFLGHRGFLHGRDFLFRVRSFVLYGSLFHSGGFLGNRSFFLGGSFFNRRGLFHSRSFLDDNRFLDDGLRYLFGDLNRRRLFHHDRHFNRSFDGHGFFQHDRNLDDFIFTLGKNPAGNADEQHRHDQQQAQPSTILHILLLVTACLDLPCSISQIPSTAHAVPSVLYARAGGARPRIWLSINCSVCSALISPTGRHERFSPVSSTAP